MDCDNEEVQATRRLKDKCKCCELIEYLKTDKQNNPNIKRELKATITSYRKRRGEKSYSGRVSYKSFNLKYCPECGRKLGDYNEM